MPTVETEVDTALRLARLSLNHLRQSLKYANPYQTVLIEKAIGNLELSVHLLTHTLAAVSAP